jgi:gliding motility-associated protein GldL
MIEQTTTRKRLDLLNFFYGFGAAIILVAAMFKFKGWQYADTLFVVGLGAEAIVFLISAFEWKKDDDEGYRWERVFPQLKRAGETAASTSVDLTVAEGTQQQQVQKVMETIVTLNQSVDTLNQATSQLTGSVKKLDEGYDSIHSSTKQYEDEIIKLKQKIAATNKSLSTLEKFSV